MTHRDRLRWSAVTIAAGAAFAVAALLTTRTGWGESLDTVVRSWVLNGLPGSLRLLLSEAARPLVIVVLAPVVAALALLALVRGGWRRAAAGLLIPFAATFATVEFRRQDVLGIGGDAFPSTHAAAGLGLLVGLAVVWPRPVTRRGLVALAVVGFLIGLGNVSWYAHQPRDVVGSALLVAAAATAAFALLGGDSPNLARDAWAGRQRRATPAHRS